MNRSIIALSFIMLLIPSMAFSSSVNEKNRIRLMALGAYMNVLNERTPQNMKNLTKMARETYDNAVKACDPKNNNEDECTKQFNIANQSIYDAESIIYNTDALNEAIRKSEFPGRVLNKQSVGAVSPLKTKVSCNPAAQEKITSGELALRVQAQVERRLKNCNTMVSAYNAVGTALELQESQLKKMVDQQKYNKVNMSKEGVTLRAAMNLLEEDYKKFLETCDDNGTSFDGTNDKINPLISPACEDLLAKIEAETNDVKAAIPPFLQVAGADEQGGQVLDKSKGQTTKVRRFTVKKNSSRYK